MTKEHMQKILAKEKKVYTQILEYYLLHRDRSTSQSIPYRSEIFMLERYIKYNKRDSNKYAVMRDEVLMKSYKILRLLNKMSKEILSSLDHTKNLNEFIKKMGELFALNQKEIDKFIDKKYKSFLSEQHDNKSFKEAKKNIQDYYAIIEINNNIINYFSSNAHRIYRLNKYTKFGILQLAITLDNTKFGQKFNPILEIYDLSVMKVLLMLFFSLFIYLIRTQLYKLFEKLLLSVKIFSKYSPEIMKVIRQPINYILVIINIEIVLSIYYNFSVVESVRIFANMAYTLIFTIIFYRIMNTAATIRIEDIEQSKTHIKSEMINIAIKIINVVIFIFGGLLLLHFAGANLATVLSGLGIGGFAIALAARETLSNFLGTISILMSDIYSQGDWIVVGKDQGTVVEIGLRVTTLRTFDNALISIPNGFIANQEVKNWNRRTLGRRIKFSIGIKYDSPVQNIQKAISEIREMLQSHPDIATDKTDYSHKHTKSSKLVSLEDSLGVKRTLFVYLDDFSDSSINILVYCFTKKTVWGSWLETKEDVMFQIIDILEQNSLEFAFPSLSLYQENKTQE